MNTFGVSGHVFTSFVPNPGFLNVCSQDLRVDAFFKGEQSSFPSSKNSSLLDPKNESHVTRLFYRYALSEFSFMTKVKLISCAEIGKISAPKMKKKYIPGAYHVFWATEASIFPPKSGSKSLKQWNPTQTRKVMGRRTLAMMSFGRYLRYMSWSI